MSSLFTCIYHQPAMNKKKSNYSPLLAIGTYRLGSICAYLSLRHTLLLPLYTVKILYQCFITIQGHLTYQYLRRVRLWSTMLRPLQPPQLGQDPLGLLPLYCLNIIPLLDNFTETFPAPTSQMSLIVTLLWALWPPHLG